MRLSVAGTIILASVFFAGALPPLPEAKMTVVVVDEQLRPIPAADVKIIFDRIVPGRGLDSFPIAGQTDDGGAYSAAGPTAGQRLGGTAEKPGYYATSFRSPLLQPKPGGNWYPWNPKIQVVLKKIGKPIPMYARRVDTDVPVVDTPVGFDLIKGDWVAPYGRGDSAHIVFTLSRRYRDHLDYESALKVSFAFPGGGIQPWDDVAEHPSGLKLPRQAPEAGYAESYVLSNRRLPGSFVQRDVSDQRNYFIRVGNSDAPLYGKIDGDIRFSPIRSKTCSLMFTYYLNPTAGDRNLEFDVDCNLSMALKDEERVKAP